MKKAKWEVKLWEEEEDERTEETKGGADQIEDNEKERLPVPSLSFQQRKPTWSELFNASVVVGGVDREEVFEPGDVRVGVTTGSTKHGGSARSLHHFQLWAHVYGGETSGQLVLWRQRRDIVADGQIQKISGPPHNLCGAGEEVVPLEIIISL